jgi:ornithine carbamoyltransferase
MGEPEEVWAERIADLTPYRVTGALMDAAGEQCRFMHCLPAFHDLEELPLTHRGQLRLEKQRGIVDDAEFHEPESDQSFGSRISRQAALRPINRSP